MYTISCYHINSKIKYARIPLDDMSGCDLFDYMEAAAQFIDECNPYFNNDDNHNNKNKILIHCAAGVSRSASIVLSYLMSREIKWNDTEKNIIDVIRQELEYKTSMNYKLLRFSEAYYFVKGCRTQIRPNDGFMTQLEKYEAIYHQYKLRGMILIIIMIKINRCCFNKWHLYVLD